MEKTFLEIQLELLKLQLEHNPRPSLILSAQYLLEVHPRHMLPDWIEILANGNIMHFEAVVQTALADIAAEKLEVSKS